MFKSKSEKIKIQKESKLHRILPVLITIGMLVVVVVQAISMFGIVYYCQKGDMELSAIWNACKELFAGNFITLGISIIGIAVSVWVGLNINITLDKEELNGKIKKYEEKQNEILDEFKKVNAENWDVLRRDYVEMLKLRWIEKILSMSNKYVLCDYLGSILKNVNLNEDMEFANFLIQYEEDYILVTKMYENNQRSECIAKAKMLLEKSVNDRPIDEELKLYFDVRKSDLQFYKCACEIRAGVKEEYTIKELEESLVIYHKLENNGNIAKYSRMMEVYAYICNTLGYSYDLMNQVSPTEERKKVAIDYMKRAVVAMKEIKGKVRGRYYRNLGLAYQRAEQWNDAREAYEKALQDNLEDNKSYVTIAGIILDNIDRVLGIKYRTKPLYEMNEEFIPFIEDIKYAIELCEESICLDHLFEDPYYKIAQAYTYLFLVEDKKKTYISEAKKYLYKLQIRGFERAGYKFTLRNMYEAQGDICKASEINNSIEGTPYNDVERLKGLYEELMRK